MRCIFVGWVLVLVIGCSSYDEARLPTPEWREGISGASVEQPPGHLRLTRLYREQMRTAPAASLDLSDPADWDIPDSMTVSAPDGVLRIEPGQGDEALQHSGNHEAWRFNMLRVRMRTDEAGAIRVAWRSSADRTLAEDATMERRLYPGEAFHTYVFPLHSRGVKNWAGRIEEIHLIPNDAGGVSEIASIALTFDPHTERPAANLEGETMEALDLQNFDWRFTVPDDGQLEVHLAVRKRSWASRGAAMRATLFRPGDLPTGSTAPEGAAHLRPLVETTFGAPEEASTVEGHRLFETELIPMRHEGHREWVPMRADLSDFAGEPVVVRFESRGRGSLNHAHVLWGNPVVRAAPGEDRRPPIILISCDTLRADHLSCYGYHRETTPNLDALAREAVLFEQAIVPEPWTLSSHMSMLTGLYPVHHGTTHVTDLSPSIATMAERLAYDAGYTAAGFTGHRWWLEAHRGFSRGFDRYVTPPEDEGALVPITRTLPVVKEWLRHYHTDDLFLFFHNYDIHTKFEGAGYPAPYWPDDESFLHFSKALGPVPAFEREGVEGGDGQGYLMAHNYGAHTVPPEEREYLIALYDDCVRMVDDHLGRLFDELKRLDLYDRALIIVTSDHGESFDEHGEYMHNQLYEHCLHVPLLVKFPEGQYAGQRYAEQVSVTSFFATALEAAGLPPQRGLDGPSLQELIEGETEAPTHVFAWNTVFRDLYAVRGIQHKLIRNNSTGADELFDLQADPGETRNLMDGPNPDAGTLPELMERFFFTEQDAWFIRAAAGDEDAAIEVTVHTGSEELEALFPTAATAGPYMDYLYTTPGGIVRADLRIRRQDFAEFTMRTPDLTEPVVRLEVASEGPWQLAIGDSISLHEESVSLELAADDLPDARPRAIDHDPDLPVVYVWYGDRTGERTEAVPLSDEAQAELEALGYL